MTSLYIAGLWGQDSYDGLLWSKPTKETLHHSHDTPGRGGCGKEQPLLQNKVQGVYLPVVTDLCSSAGSSSVLGWLRCEDNYPCTCIATAMLDCCKCLWVCKIISMLYNLITSWHAHLLSLVARHSVMTQRMLRLALRAPCPHLLRPEEDCTTHTPKTSLSHTTLKSL